jgi:hypothetical protein
MNREAAMLKSVARVVLSAPILRHSVLRSSRADAAALRRECGETFIPELALNFLACKR